MKPIILVDRNILQPEKRRELEAEGYVVVEMPAGQRFDIIPSPDASKNLDPLWTDFVEALYRTFAIPYYRESPAYEAVKKLREKYGNPA